jgi:two-component system chemotaxis response regulator CheY
MRVLIVDDSALVQSVLKSFVEKHLNFKVAGIAANGAEGVQMYKDLLPELVFMDIQMPILDGVEALNQILNFNPFARVIMCSSVNDTGVILKCIKRGAKTFIKKTQELADPLNLECMKREVDLALHLDESAVQEP